MTYMRTSLFILLISLISSIAIAAIPAWKIVPEDSSIMFTATQNNSPVSGKFKTFTGDIYFDPDQLNASHVKVIVDMDSVTTSYPHVAETLKTSEWFNVKVFPQAIFKSKSLTKTGDKTYQATGTLTIRDKTLPVTVNFTLEEYSNTNANVKGYTLLKRTGFGVGQGDWAKTDGVKDEVRVDFVLKATRT